MDREDFTHAELMLPYVQWEDLAKRLMPYLRSEVRIWLFAWKRWDNDQSVRNDSMRPYERRGHYIGWFMANEWRDEHEIKCSHCGMPIWRGCGCNDEDVLVPYPDENCT